MKIGIGLTIFMETAEQLKLAIDSINSFKSKHELVYYARITKAQEGVCKGLQGVVTMRIGYNRTNCLAGSWNGCIDDLLKEGCDYVIIPNLDVIMEPETIDSLVDFAETHGGVMWSPRMERNCVNRPAGDYVVDYIGSNNYDTYAFFMVNKELFEKVGRFDENFIPAYCEDVDMERRIHFANQIHWCVNTPFFHLENVSMNYAKNPEKTRNELIETSTGALDYFIRKWGCKPREEGWKSPFNGNVNVL